MGAGYSKMCPKCGFEFESLEGIGFLFPLVYKETVEDAKRGKLGDKIKEFFQEHEDGAINAERVTLCCDKCGCLSMDKDLTMYIPTEDGVPFEDLEYLTKNDLDMYYEEYAKYEHRCDECGGTMRILDKNEDMLCPECKIPMVEEQIICWD